MIIAITAYNSGEDMEPIEIGDVVPPKEIVSAAQNANEGASAYLESLLYSLWETWRGLFPDVESDSLFASWLVDKHNWTWSNDTIFPITISY